MNVNLSEGELKLLAHLHENAIGFDDTCQFDPAAVRTALDIDEPTFRRQVSYLASFRLVGIEEEGVEPFDKSSPSSIITGIYLTGAGENFMRELEQAPSIGRKLTVGVVSELWAMGKGTIVSTSGQILAEFVKQFLRYITPRNTESE